MKKTTIIFDLDGTLLYTLEDLKDAVNYALRTLGYAEHDLDEMRRFFGNGIRYALEQAEPGWWRCLKSITESTVWTGPAPMTGSCLCLQS